MISAADVSEAVRATLQEHLPRYLAAGVNGRPGLPAPGSYAEVPTPEAILRVKGAALAVVVPRTLGVDRSGDASYDATWLVNVVVWHEAKRNMPLITAAADYVACVRAVVLAYQSFGGVASRDGVTWREDSTDLVGDELSPQTLGMGVCEFSVRVPGVADETPLPLTPGPGPTVLTTEVHHPS